MTLRQSLVAWTLLAGLAAGCGGGGGGGTSGPDPTPGPEPETILPLGDTSDGPLLAIAAETDAQGGVQPLPLPDVPVQPLAVGAALATTFRVIDDESFRTVPNVRVDVVSDNREAIVLCSDPAFMPTVHPVTLGGAGAVDVLATSVFASPMQRRGNGEYWGRIRPYAATHARTSHLDLLRDRFFVPVASGATWSTVETSVTSHLTDWSQAGRANGNHAYVIVAIPIASGLEAKHKLVCYRGDAVVMGAWLSKNMPAYFGKSSYTFDVHKYTGVQSQRLLLVTLNTLEVQAESVGTGVVQGVATAHPSGALLSGADISLHSFDPRCKVFGKIRTGADGAYRFDGVPSGAYMLRVAKSGYESRATDDAIIDEEGGTVTEDVWLNTIPDAILAYDASITYVLPGVTTTLGVQIANRGGTQSLAWSFSLPPPGTWIVTPSQGVLQPGQSQRVLFTPPAGAKANNHTLRLTSDVGGETGFIYAPIYVEGDRNLILQSPSLSVSSVRPGNKVDVSYNYAGTGPGSGSHYLKRITISKSSSISPTDARLDDDDVYGAYSLSFMPFASGGGTTRTVIPPWVTPGTWYIGITLDGSNVLGETNEGDNFTSLPITIIGQTSTIAKPGPFAVSSATAEYKAGKLQIPVVWTAASGAAQYQVRRNGSVVSPLLADGTTEWTDLSVQEGATYSYDVVATNAGGTRTAKPFPSTVTKRAQPYAARIENGDFATGETAANSVPHWVAKGDFWVGHGPGFDAYSIAPGYAAGGADRTTGASTGGSVESRGSLSQEFTIPAGTSRAWLAFSHNITTTEPSPVAPMHDTMTVALYDLNDNVIATLARFGNADGIGQVRGAYVRKMYNLKDFIGKTVKLGFSVWSRPPNPTVFRIDDVELIVDNEVATNQLYWPISGFFKQNVSRDECPPPGTPDCTAHRGLDISSGIADPVVDPNHMAVWTRGPTEMKRGATVYAAATGVVVNDPLDPTKFSDTFGRYVLLRHPSGEFTRYAHLHQALVSSGQTVTVGKEIGIEGNTGKTDPTTPTGTHVHFEFFRDIAGGRGQTADPGETPKPYPSVTVGSKVSTSMPIPTWRLGN